MNDGLAKVLTKQETPQNPQTLLLDRVREVLNSMVAAKQPTPQPQTGTQWRDVRPGKPLNDYLKEQGLY